MIFENRLSLEERKEVLDLYEHEHNNLRNLYFLKLKINEIGWEEYLSQSNSISISEARSRLKNLSDLERIRRLEYDIIKSIIILNKDQTTASPSNLAYRVEDMLMLDSSFEEVNFEYLKESPPIITVNPILSVSIYNLVQNAVKHAKARKIIITAEHLEQAPQNQDIFKTEPQDIAFRGYYKISVFNDGRGFDNLRGLSSYLERGVSTAGGGFGLYFIRLACKYLGCLLEIESDQESSKVSIYHPSYISK